MQCLAATTYRLVFMDLEISYSTNVMQTLVYRTVYNVTFYLYLCSQRRIHTYKRIDDPSIYNRLETVALFMSQLLRTPNFRNKT